MKNLKTNIATFVLMTIFLVSTTFANTGILVAGFSSGNETQPCNAETSNEDKGVILSSDFTGILVAGFTGILVAGYTGIDIDSSAKEQIDCGILVAG